MRIDDAIDLYERHMSQAQNDALAEMVLYIAGGLERGDFDAAQITGGVLRALVDKARAVPDEVSIGVVWSLADDVIRSAAKSV